MLRVINGRGVMSALLFLNTTGYRLIVQRAGGTAQAKVAAFRLTISDLMRAYENVPA